jgi:Domain of unknown function (DUF4258)
VSGTLERIHELVNKGDWVISDHAYKALADDEIAFEDVLSTLKSGFVVEDYPEYHKGPAVLILTATKVSPALHSLWGVPLDERRPATLITAYIPDPSKWEPDNQTRKMK